MCGSFRGQGDIAPSAFRLWRLETQPRIRFLKAALNAECAGVQVYIAPLQAQQLATTHSSGQRQRDDGIECVSVELGEHVCNLLGAQYLDLIFLYLRRRMNGSDVPSKRSVLDGALQHEAQDLVSVTDRAS